MSKEYTNYQTLLQSKLKINEMFEEKKRIVQQRNANNATLLENFKGAAANVYDEASKAFLDTLNKSQMAANEKLDSDINYWNNQLSDAEKQAAEEYKSKIGL